MKNIFRQNKKNSLLIILIIAGGVSIGITYATTFTDTVIINPGPLGVGTTSPGQQLDVTGPAANIRVGSTTDALHGIIVTPDGSTEKAYLYTTGGNANHAGHLRLTNGNNDVTIADILMRNAASSTINYITNSGNSYLTGGYVGIGTTSPTHELTVKNADNNAPSITILSAADNNKRFYFQADGINNFANIRAYNENPSSPGPLNLILESSGGNVGIGTPSPGQKLDVAGNIGLTGNIQGESTTTLKIIPATNQAICIGSGC